MTKSKADRIKATIAMEILIDESARFEDSLGTFDVSVAGEQKGIVTQDELTKDILLSLPDGAAVRINLNALGAGVVKSWGQWRVKKCVKKGCKK